MFSDSAAHHEPPVLKKKRRLTAFDIRFLLRKAIETRHFFCFFDRFFRIGFLFKFDKKRDFIIFFKTLLD